LPRLCLYMDPFNAKALAANGPKYMLDPKTTISSGAYIIKNWEPTRWEVVANDKAAPDLRPLIQRMINVPYPNAFQAYQAGQIDSTSIGDAASLETVLNDPNLAKDVYPDVGDFRTDYYFFNVTKAPFDNLKFRQALSHLLDRETIVKNITKALARPA